MTAGGLLEHSFPCEVLAVVSTGRPLTDVRLGSGSKMDCNNLILSSDSWSESLEQKISFNLDWIASILSFFLFH